MHPERVPEASHRVQRSHLAAALCRGRIHLKNLRDSLLDDTAQGVHDQAVAVVTADPAKTAEFNLTPDMLTDLKAPSPPMVPPSAPRAPPSPAASPNSTAPPTTSKTSSTASSSNSPPTIPPSPPPTPPPAKSSAPATTTNPNPPRPPCPPWRILEPLPGTGRALGFPPHGLFPLTAFRGPVKLGREWRQQANKN